jgi:pantoate kinase
LKETVAFSPGHITGLFQICDQSADPLSKGSRGAGVSTKLGVTTKVQIEPSIKTSFKITINGEMTKSAILSEYVLKTFLSRVKGKHRILVEHQAGVPIGSGFGTSGAGALSLGLALNEVFNLNLSQVQIGQIAHVAEIECKTGLGTVIGETYGGFEIRIKAGAPGVGELRQIPINDDYAIACLNFAPISKRDILTNETHRDRINMVGGKLVDELIKDSTPNCFMALSRRFAEHVGLISLRLRNVLNETDREGITCSMAMFGENLFAVADHDSLKRLTKIFHEHAQCENNVIVSEIDFKGARLL